LRYIDGRAWLVTPNDSDVAIVRIKLVLGTQDVYVRNWSVGNEDGQTTTTWNNDGGGGGNDEASIGGLIKEFTKEVLKKLIPKVEHTGEKKSSTTGGQLTYGQMWAEPEWTLALVMPERQPPPPPPGPFGLEPYTVYFDTGKSNADAYRSPLTSMQDQ